MKILGIRFCSVSDQAEQLAAFLGVPNLFPACAERNAGSVPVESVGAEVRPPNFPGCPAHSCALDSPTGPIYIAPPIDNRIDEPQMHLKSLTSMSMRMVMPGPGRAAFVLR